MILIIFFWQKVLKERQIRKISKNKKALMYKTSLTIITTLCLFIFGFFKAKVTGQPPIKGALKVTAIGLVAAAAAFGIAKLVG